MQRNERTTTKPLRRRVLPPDEWRAFIHRAVPPSRRPWYWRWSGGLVIPRGLWQWGEREDTLTLCEGAGDMVEAHEFDHYLRQSGAHPPLRFWRQWAFDVTAPFAPRIRDRHAIVPRMRAWRLDLRERRA